ncbi:phenylacetate--CoA ligase family protein [Microbulbifer sp. GL-2]|uniref:phenylacetate--CoA ligase family protein n=1 Tax=Microbulbifer sp. GL-2 TaxID=2591606 RepID=UPI00118077A4|nr:AMP-binding protein [Microbulbifer sp. GL-2]
MNYNELLADFQKIHNQSEIEQRAFKDRLVRRQLQEAITKSNYYRELIDHNNIDIGVIQSCADLHLLPIISSEIFSESMSKVSMAFDDIVRYCHTSGSTGTTKRVPYTRKDIDNAVTSQARSYLFAGVEPFDKCLCAMTYGPWPSGMICHAASEIFGLTIPADSFLGLDHQLQSLQKDKLNYMVCLPSLLPRLEQHCLEKDISPESLNVRNIFMVGELFSEDFRSYYEKLFNSKLINMYANTEFGLVATECRHHNLHVWEDYFHAEVIDPDTGEPCEFGVTGELVITALQREALPLIRYNTHDLVEMHSGPCECGHPGTYLGPIQGRSDNMFTVNGANVYPIMLENTITGTTGLSSFYHCIIEKVDGYDHLTFKIEAREAVDKQGKIGLAQLFYSNLSGSDVTLRMIFLGLKSALRLNIEILQPGEISQKPGKVKKIIDRR